MKKTLLLTPVFILMLVLAWAAPAHAGGSDDPTPYTVTKKGIQLPQGDTFPAHGHVNIRMADGSTASVRFDPYNNQPGGVWIGKSYIPWKAFGFKSTDVCVAWVQIHGYNEHFGEGGQAPIGKACKTTPAPGPDTKQDDDEGACGPVGSCGKVPDLTGEAISAVGLCEGTEFVTTTKNWEKYDGVRTYVGSDAEETREYDPTCQNDVAPPATPVSDHATFTG